MSYQLPHQPGQYPGGPYQPGPPGRRLGGAAILGIALAAGLGIVILAAATVVAFGADDGSSNSSPGDVATQFVDAINDGDRAAAEEALCNDALTTVYPAVDELTGGDTQIGLEDEVSEAELPPQAAVAGTLGGERVEGAIAMRQRMAPGEMITEPDAPWCVSRFTVGPLTG